MNLKKEHKTGFLSRRTLVTFYFICELGFVLDASKR